MSKTLHQFGRVLFDELEQIAVRRRSGFASLKWVRAKLLKARWEIRKLAKEAAGPSLDPLFLRKNAATCALRARDALALATEAAEAVDQLAETMRGMLITAEEARKKIKPPWCDLRLMSSVKGVSDIPRGGEDLIIVAAVDNALHFRMFDRDGKMVVDTGERRLTEQAPQIEVLRMLLAGLWPPHEPSESEKDRIITAVTSIVGQTPRTAWGWLRDIDEVLPPTTRADWETRMAAVSTKLSQLADTLHTAQLCVQEIRDQKPDGVHEAPVSREPVVQWSQDLASELRTAARRFKKVRSAFREMAKAKNDAMVEFDGLVAEQSDASRYEIYGDVEDGAQKCATRMETVGLAFSGGGIRSATFNLGFLQGAAALGMLKQFDYLSTVSGGGYIGAWFAAWVLREGGREPKPPAAAENTARAWFTALVRGDGGRAGGPEPPADESDRKRYEAEVSAKRQRTPRALENVQKQLSPSRARQATAVRGWVSPATSGDGREATVPPTRLERTVEEEPGPVYHLRAHSNYLAPKIGLLSIDTWTMVSVYVRNLFLNQFIFLPMVLAVIALPRLLLLLFTHSTSDPMTTRAREWLERHPGWPVLPVVLPAIVVTLLITPRLVDFLAFRILRRFHRWKAGLMILIIVAIGIAALLTLLIELFLPLLIPGTWLARHPRAAGLAVLPLAALGAVLAAVINKSRVVDLVWWVARGPYERTKGWAILFVLVLGVVSSASWLVPLVEVGEPFMRWLTGDLAMFLCTFGMAWVGFYGTYQTLAQIRASRRPAPAVPADHRMTKQTVWRRIMVPLTFVSFGVSLLFARPEGPFLIWPLPSLAGWFDRATGNWCGIKFWLAVCFGGLVGLMRLASSAMTNWKDKSRQWTLIERVGRAWSAFSSGLISGAGLAAVFLWLREPGTVPPGALGAVMMSFGPALVMVAIGAGSAIEVGLIGGYSDEDTREWRASLSAYLLKIGTLWAALCVLSIYSPLFLIWAGGRAAWATGAVLVVISVFGALAGRRERTDGVKTSKSPREFLAKIAPPAFIIVLVVAVSVLVAKLQGVHIPIEGADTFLKQLSHAGQERTWAVILVSAYMAMVGCVHANINLFGLNAFYANRLVRCYLGASRPREAPKEGRPNFAPTNSPGPVRRANPITGFDFNDDFPLHELAIARSWGRDDLVVNYRGPYHLINTAMNLVAGDELAWQERMAESFILSPLYCGSKTTGYRRATKIVRSDLEDDELEPKDWGLPPSSAMSGYGDDIRLGTAISVSGAAASPNAGYHSSPLVTILMTILNARLGLWLGNPLQAAWRRSGPGFAFYFLLELFGRTTSKERYVYLSDGGHFENLGAYELVRRRCRYIVLCDAGADPALSFWDLGSLVRKCRQDFGIRIEVDISPLLKKAGTPHSKWHCAVGQIHYGDVDVGALPGTLFYIKPSLNGDEPSDVRNYLVDHPTFPHESTANQFFSESQFESYRALGEHIALHVFGDVVRDAGPDSSPATLFSRLRRRWAQAPPNLDRDFLESMKPFVKIHQALRTDPKLAGLSHELYPELLQPPSDGPAHAPTTPQRDDRAAVHAVIEMLQAMENAWIAVNLDVYSDQPLNRGWMNVFRRWIGSGIFRTHWPAVRGEFSEGFVRFCETELSLTVPEPKVAWFEGDPRKEGRTIPLSRFLEGLRALDKEFSLEWPHLVLHEIGDGRTGLADMFQHARNHPPVPRKWPMAVLILPGETPHDGRPTSEPSYYGVILAWGPYEGVVELVVWLRGAYRTLGLGRAVKKTLNEFKEDLKSLLPNGYTLRTRYPSDERSRGKQRWQKTLWTEFFQNQGFYREGSDKLGDDQDTLIYRYEPR